eukprot:1033390-Rhodomonas_salina.2
MCIRDSSEAETSRGVTRRRRPVLGLRTFYDASALNCLRPPVLPGPGAYDIPEGRSFISLPSQYHLLRVRFGLAAHACGTDVDRSRVATCCQDQSRVLYDPPVRIHCTRNPSDRSDGDRRDSCTWNRCTILQSPHHWARARRRRVSDMMLTLRNVSRDAALGVLSLSPELSGTFPARDAAAVTAAMIAEQFDEMY